MTDLVDDTGSAGVAADPKAGAVAADTTPAKDGAAAAAPAKAPPAAAAPKTLASGAELHVATAPASWPDNWREIAARDRLAEETGVEPDKVDKKKLATEIKRLERMASPSALWGRTAQLEAKLSAGDTVKVPGAKATDEEKATFFKALGVPETPDEYFPAVKLANGRTLGDADKESFLYFAKRLHPEGVTPRQMSVLADSWLDYQQAAADERTSGDIQFMANSERDLQKDWGREFKANQVVLKNIFADHPGLEEYVNSSRGPAGQLLGNDPFFLKAMVDFGRELYPASQNLGGAGGDPTQSRLDEIRQLTRDGKSTPELEKEQTELIAQQQAAANRGSRRRAA